MAQKSDEVRREHHVTHLYHPAEKISCKNPFRRCERSSHRQRGEEVDAQGSGSLESPVPSFHVEPAIFTENACLAERVAAVGVLHEASRVRAMAESLRVSQFVKHDAEKLSVTARTIGREDRNAGTDAASQAHDSAVGATAEIVQPDVSLRQADDQIFLRLVGNEDAVQKVRPIAFVVLAPTRQRLIGQREMPGETTARIVCSQRIHHRPLQFPTHLAERINPNRRHLVLPNGGRGVCLRLRRRRRSLIFPAAKENGGQHKKHTRFKDSTFHKQTMFSYLKSMRTMYRSGKRKVWRISFPDTQIPA